MCLTLLGGRGGGSAESDMSDFWPDFFLQMAPKLASPLKVFVFFVTLPLLMLTPSHLQHIVSIRGSRSQVHTFTL